MKIRVLIVPSRKPITLEEIARRCPDLFILLEQERCQLVLEEWDGAIKSLPQAEQVMIYLTVELLLSLRGKSGKLPNGFARVAEFASECTRLGHLAFSENATYLQQTGNLTDEGFAEYVLDLLDNIKKWEKLQSEPPENTVH